MTCNDTDTKKPDGNEYAAPFQDYDNAMLGTSALLGIASGIMGLLTLVFMAVCKQLAAR